MSVWVMIKYLSRIIMVILNELSSCQIGNDIIGEDNLMRAVIKKHNCDILDVDNKNISFYVRDTNETIKYIFIICLVD